MNKRSLRTHARNARLLTPAEFASRLPDTTADTVRRWVRSGDIPAVVLPGGRMYLEEHLLEEILNPKFLTEEQHQADTPGDAAPLVDPAQLSLLDDLAVGA